MELKTSSEVISFTRQLEEAGIRFYEALAKRFIKDEETMLALVKENKRNVAQVERAYYGVITDALEGCFAFAINPDNYAPDVELPENVSYAEALKQALAVEDKMQQFYTDAAEQSKSLMADVPRTFTLLNNKRGKRIELLKSLIANPS